MVAMGTSLQIHVGKERCSKMVEQDDGAVDRFPEADEGRTMNFICYTGNIERFLFVIVIHLGNHVSTDSVVSKRRETNKIVRKAKGLIVQSPGHLSETFCFD